MSLVPFFHLYEWTYDLDIDAALYAWRVRIFEPENNPWR